LPNDGCYTGLRCFSLAVVVRSAYRSSRASQRAARSPRSRRFRNTRPSQLSRRGNPTALAPDPAAPERRSSDPGDGYLIALAESERAVLVSGDRHLLELADELPIRTARAFIEKLVQPN